jgi:serine/threonine protein kinase
MRYQGGHHLMMVLELCSTAVHAYLRSKPDLRVETRSLMALDISGMCCCLRDSEEAEQGLHADEFTCTEGLGFLVGEKIIHRDLAGERLECVCECVSTDMFIDSCLVAAARNCLVSFDGTVKIGDFGRAQLADKNGQCE